MLLEAPQMWRMKRYNVLGTELVYRAWTGNSYTAYYVSQYYLLIKVYKEI